MSRFGSNRDFPREPHLRDPRDPFLRSNPSSSHADDEAYYDEEQLGHEQPYYDERTPPIDTPNHDPRHPQTMRPFRADDARQARRDPTAGFHRGTDPRSSFSSTHNQHYQRDELRELGFWRNDEYETGDENDYPENKPSPVKFVTAISGLVIVSTSI